MSTQQAREEYIKAQKMGMKEVKECTAAGKPTYPAVLDDILPSAADDIYKEIGLIEIPINRIVGTKSAGRITAFSPSFLPLLDDDILAALRPGQQILIDDGAMELMVESHDGDIISIFVE